VCGTGSLTRSCGPPGRCLYAAEVRIPTSPTALSKGRSSTLRYIHDRSPLATSSTSPRHSSSLLCQGKRQQVRLTCNCCHARPRASDLLSSSSRRWLELYLARNHESHQGPLGARSMSHSGAEALSGRRSSSITCFARTTAWWTGWSMFARIPCGLGWYVWRRIIAGFGKGEFPSYEVVVGNPRGRSGRPTGSQTRSHTHKGLPDTTRHIPSVT